MTWEKYPGGRTNIQEFFRGKKKFAPENSVFMPWHSNLPPRNQCTRCRKRMLKKITFLYKLCTLTFV